MSLTVPIHRLESFSTHIYYHISSLLRYYRRSMSSTQLTPEEIDKALASMPHSTRIKKINKYFIFLLVPVILLLLTEFISWLTISPSFRVTLYVSYRVDLRNLFKPAFERANFSMTHDFPLTSYMLNIPSSWTVWENWYRRSSDFGSRVALENAFESFPRKVIYQSIGKHSGLLPNGLIPLESPDDIVAVVPEKLMEDMVHDWVKWKHDFMNWQWGFLAVHIALHLLSWLCTVVFLQEFWLWIPAGLYLVHTTAYVVCLTVLLVTFNDSNTTLVKLLFSENYENWGLTISFEDYGAMADCVLAFFTTGLGNILVGLGAVSGDIGYFSHPSLTNSEVGAQDGIASLLRLETRDRRLAKELKVEGQNTV